MHWWISLWNDYFLSNFLYFFLPLLALHLRYSSFSRFLLQLYSIEINSLETYRNLILLPRYIRLSDTTPMSKVRELLIDHWGLFRPHRPHLALSLIGGAKNFRMEGRKRETFKVGCSFVFTIQKFLI